MVHETNFILNILYLVYLPIVIATNGIFNALDIETTKSCDVNGRVAGDSCLF